MLFQQLGRVQVAGRWLCGLANTSSKMFIVDFHAEEVGDHFFSNFCLFVFFFLILVAQRDTACLRIMGSILWNN